MDISYILEQSADFFGQLGNFLYNLVFYQVNVGNISVPLIGVVFALGVGFIVFITIIKFIL